MGFMGTKTARREAAIIGGSDSLTILSQSVVFLSNRGQTSVNLSFKIAPRDRKLGLVIPKNAPTRPNRAEFAQFLNPELDLLHIKMEHLNQITQRRG